MNEQATAAVQCAIAAIRRAEHADREMITRASAEAIGRLHLPHADVESARRELVRASGFPDVVVAGLNAGLSAPRKANPVPRTAEGLRIVLIPGAHATPFGYVEQSIEGCANAIATEIAPDVRPMSLSEMRRLIDARISLSKYVLIRKQPVRVKKSVTGEIARAVRMLFAQAKTETSLPPDLGRLVLAWFEREAEKAIATARVFGIAKEIRAFTWLTERIASPRVLAEFSRAALAANAGRVVEGHRVVRCWTDAHPRWRLDPE